ncbi:DUF5780 domain-containing protein [Clostridium sp. D33t1_170424_F3]|uniref:DUF5780 domain-containing protein n=1 Tax=Clostridium sp. D33t1_170424_F3 TaxID=2787099 RepID=UPI0018AB72A2|nr:DUF5780 domain-containing protein [Clostridium sp. D33t1_170424_F3]
MNCPKCGENIGAYRYCPFCGTTVEQSSYSENVTPSLDQPATLADEKTKKRRLSPAVIITCCVLAAVIVFCALMALGNIQNYPDKIISAVKEGQTEQAVLLYSENIEGNKKEEEQVKERLISHAQSIEKDFENKKISYQDAEDQLNTIMEIRIIGDVRTIQDNVDRLHKSRVAYQTGLEYLKSNDYENAIDNLKNVIESDTNYQDAQDRINTSSQKYIEELLKSIDDFKNQEKYLEALNAAKKGLTLFPDTSTLMIAKEDCQNLYDQQVAQNKAKKVEEAKQSQLIPVTDCKIKVQSTDMKSLYPDMICAIVKNNSDKTIDYLEISFIGFDENGYPLKIEGDLDFSGAALEKFAKGDALNIIPAASWGDDMGFKLISNHKVKTPMACVVKAKFYDGSEWENPYYKYFKEEYVGKPLN